MYRVEIIVKLKDEVKDTRGEAAGKLLARLNVENESNFRTGSYFSFDLHCDDEKSAKEKLEFIIKEVISNPVVHTHKILSFEEIK